MGLHEPFARTGHFGMLYPKVRFMGVCSNRGTFLYGFLYTLCQDRPLRYVISESTLYPNTL